MRLSGFNIVELWRLRLPTNLNVDCTKLAHTEQTRPFISEILDIG